MKINTSQISMDASAEHKDVNGKSTQLAAGMQKEKPRFQLRLSTSSGFSRERVEESHQSQRLMATSLVEGPTGKENYKTSANKVVERLAQRVTGHRIRLRRVHGLRNGGNITLSEPINPPGQQAVFSLTSHTTSYHYEKMSVRSSGFVELADGRNVSFSLNVSMERESMVRESVSWRAVDRVLMDPLVFSFDCDLRMLMNKKFYFDLNNDGIITNGSELFGPTTGHGFRELAQHDLDGNGWIDENDPVFSKLRIWKPGSPTGTELIGLAEAGIGAISLSHNQNSFQLRDTNNMLMGKVTASGFFLTEKGEVRPLQEIKLALRERVSKKAERAAVKETRDTQSNSSGGRDLMASLFPGKQREIWLASVEARNRTTIPT